MSDRLTVIENTTLFELLISRLDGWSRSKIKQRLKNGCVSVNGRPVTRHDHPVQAGDRVVVAASARGTPGPRQRLDILYRDRDLIAIDKPAGLLSVGSPKSDEPHALGMLRTQVSRPNRPLKLWPVHRLDRDTSGVLLFATSREAREAVMANWPAAEKTYLAVVEGRPSPAEGTIDQALRLDPDIYQMHVGPHPDAKRAVTHFTTERSAGGRSLLRVTLETGRQHQIRAHLAWLGHPVVGDRRYGTAGERMGLHALRLRILKPGTDKRLVFESPLPVDIMALLH
ncbi:MAG: RluA family pseudouridine synthase [Xanthomonadales bacterium]|nr:RluA family pseudouridine synthase [Gammaproteobacteria bacterium]MBT8051012.1 RluA family pseudouridine synthase [Gammaproteobacteria bacterium]MBT8057536.1 RluA family pseudouridine synthase [Gammaproteobacteria bacterium]NNJ79203.1 RluA family pseudouridine synthase [Xanthomonadales bacterium]NNL05862.1 RluA family pseudouridine synthase [Xanthomonadales bacterium]